MIPTNDEFQALPPRNCFHCAKLLTWPCTIFERPGVSIALHADCIWPFAETLIDDILKIKGEHPDQLKEWDFAVKKDKT